MTLPLPAGQISEEPPYRHGSRARVGVLLVNLGTPDAPTAPALRRYLKEFLSDPRVVEIPKLIWWPILNLIILTVRPAKSAAKYASVWMPEGSPLRVYSVAQKDRLQALLQEKGLDIAVELSMRYGQPSIAAGIDALKARGVTRMVVLPLYPQFSASTTATVFDKVYESLARLRNPPALRLVRSFCDFPAYIQAWADQIRAYWQQHGRGDLLLFSFHGVPKRSLLKGDPYHCECHKTGRLIAEALGLAPHEWKLAFQSRFGRAEWLKPYTAESLEALPAQGIKRLDIACPGFISDCLETLEEIAMEGREDFLEAGGTSYHYIACLNDSYAAIAMLEALVLQETAGWPIGQDTPQAQADRALGRDRALALGAAD